MRVWLPIAVVALAIAGGAFFVSCASLSKPTIERRLLELAKNRTAAQRGYASLQARAAILGESRDVEYRWLRAGAPGRPIVVLVHGTPGSALTWSEAIDAGLGEAFDIYAIEMLGHGTARDSLNETTFQACADYLRGFLAALDLRDVTLVGQSYGGEFAWRAALDERDRIRRLVLIDSAGLARADGEWLPEEVKLREWSVAPLGYLLNSRSRIRGALQPHFRDPVSDERVEEMYLVCANAGNWGAIVDLARDENGARADQLSTLSIPTLLVFGDRDIAYPPDKFGMGFARRIPGSRLVRIADCGHYPQEERPAELARCLIEFVR